MESNITNNLRNYFWHESMNLCTNKEQQVMRNTYLINKKDVKAGLNCVLYDCIITVSVVRPTELIKVGSGKQQK